ncbi:MAG: glycyl-radical enzyme activating protein [Acidobacteria bacterium]|nr:glycyl-radical enzyme activating protein [Acidobacteriota bacterium]
MDVQSKTDSLVDEAYTRSKGLIFEIRRFCLHDGPGIRTTVFLKGCPLSCLWCHNPEGRSYKPSLMYFEDRCRQCRDCIPACPHGAIREVDSKILTGPECEASGMCVEACPSEARLISGRWMTIPEVVGQVEKDLVFYDESQGGVTFSGGEPFYQPVFLNSLLDAFRDRRIHTTLETCGFVKSDILRSLMGKIDLFLFDIKVLDPAKHKEYVGVSNELIQQNLEMLVGEGAHLIVRVPIIPTVNDSTDEVDGLGRLLCRLHISDVHLLPYHRMGSAKYARLQMPYVLNIDPPSPEAMLSLSSRLENQGLNVTIGGQE